MKIGNSMFFHKISKKKKKKHLPKSGRINFISTLETT